MFFPEYGFLSFQFTGKTVGIIGMGRIVKAIATIAEAFCCPIAYFSRTEKPDLSTSIIQVLWNWPPTCDVLCIFLKQTIVDTGGLTVNIWM